MKIRLLIGLSVILAVLSVRAAYKIGIHRGVELGAALCAEEPAVRWARR